MTWKVTSGRRFLREYKKLSTNIRNAIDDEVIKIAKNPEIGVRKSGKLSKFFVHKFVFQRVLYLLAYTKDKEIRIVNLESIGPHENFYEKLQR
jgi:mRNA-degrading endonuclease RelE of RelBE toxin-antitoxin system